MIKISVHRKYIDENTGYCDCYCDYMYFAMNKKPKLLMYAYFDYYPSNRNKLERLLFLSRTEYKNKIDLHGYEYIEIYMYTLKEFQKYIEVLQLFDPDHKYLYNKELVKLKGVFRQKITHMGQKSPKIPGFLI